MAFRDEPSVIKVDVYMLEPFFQSLLGRLRYGAWAFAIFSQNMENLIFSVKIRKLIVWAFFHDVLSKMAKGNFWGIHWRFERWAWAFTLNYQQSGSDEDHSIQSTRVWDFYNRNAFVVPFQVRLCPLVPNFLIPFGHQ